MSIDYFGLGLPQSIMDAVQYSPMEDAALTILRRAFPDVVSLSLIPDIQTPSVSDPSVPAEFFILARRGNMLGEWEGNPQGFMDAGGVEINVFTQDPNGDLKGAVVSEAVRAAFETASREKWRINETTTIHSIRMTSEPIRKSDWVNSQGPVQQADLPVGAWRHITMYEFHTRRMRQ